MGGKESKGSYSVLPHDQPEDPSLSFPTVSATNTAHEKAILECMCTRRPNLLTCAPVPMATLELVKFDVLVAWFIREEHLDKSLSKQVAVNTDHDTLYLQVHQMAQRITNPVNLVLWALDSQHSQSCFVCRFLSNPCNIMAFLHMMGTKWNQCPIPNPFPNLGPPTLFCWLAAVNKDEKRSELVKCIIRSRWDIFSVSPMHDILYLIEQYWEHGGCKNLLAIVKVLPAGIQENGANFVRLLQHAIRTAVAERNRSRIGIIVSSCLACTKSNSLFRLDIYAVSSHLKDWMKVLAPFPLDMKVLHDFQAGITKIIRRHQRAVETRAELFEGLQFPFALTLIVLRYSYHPLLVDQIYGIHDTSAAAAAAAAAAATATQQNSPIV